MNARSLMKTPLWDIGPFPGVAAAITLAHLTIRIRMVSVHG